MDSDSQYEDNSHGNFDDVYHKLTQKEANQYPYNCIGFLTFIRFDQIAKGTAFLIAPNLAITTAHNLYNKKFEQYSIKNGPILFYPGISGKLGSPYKVVDYRFPKEYESCDDKIRYKYDYALLKLEGKITRAEYLTLKYNFKGNNNEDIGIYGYHGAGCNKLQAIQEGIWKSKSHHSQDIHLRYKISTQFGNSGCPILYKNTAIAIHQGTWNKGPNGPINQGRLMDIQLLDNISKWQKQMKRFSIKVDLSQTKIKDKQILKQQLINKIKQIEINDIKSLKYNEKWQYKVTDNIKQTQFKDRKIQSLKKLQQQKNQIEFKFKPMPQYNRYETNLNKIYEQDRKSLNPLPSSSRNQVKTQKTPEKIQTKARDKTMSLFLNKTQINNPNSSKKDHDKSNYSKLVTSTKNQWMNQVNTIKNKKQIINTSFRSQFKWKQNTPVSSKFQISNNNKIVRINGFLSFGYDQCYQAISQNSLPQGQIVELKFMINKYGGDAAIGLGIISGNRINHQYTGGIDHGESIGYWSDPKTKRGAIIKDGKIMHNWNEKLFISPKNKLIIKINLKSYKIAFINTTQNSQTIRLIELLDDYWGQQQIYINASMSQKYDCIQMINY